MKNIFVYKTGATCRYDPEKWIIKWSNFSCAKQGRRQRQREWEVYDRATRIMINSSLEVDKWMLRELNRHECTLTSVNWLMKAFCFCVVVVVDSSKFDTFLIRPVRLSKKATDGKTFIRCVAIRMRGSRKRVSHSSIREAISIMLVFLLST